MGGWGYEGGGAIAHVSGWGGGGEGGLGGSKWVNFGSNLGHFVINFWSNFGHFWSIFIKFHECDGCMVSGVVCGEFCVSG